MHYKALTAVCIASASLSIAAALTTSAYVAIALALLSLASFYLLRRRLGGSGDGGNNDALQLVTNMVDNYSSSISTAKLLNISLSKNFWFFKDMNESISKYAVGGSAASAFSKPLRSDSAALRDVTSIIIQRLDGGTDILGPLKEVKKRIDMANRYRLKSLGSVLNANSVVGLGSVLFFPAFAGISLQIIRFAGMSQGVAVVSGQSLISIFAFYIIYINIINFKHSSADALRIEKSALSSSVAMLVFKLCSQLSIAML